MKCFALFALLLSTPAFGTYECLLSEEHLGEQVSDEVRQVLADGQRAFGVNLVKTIFEEMTAAEMSENILLSPASIYQTLTLAYFGAEGQTQDEIANLILYNNSSDDKVSRNDVASNYLFERAFFALKEMDPNLGYELVHANKFYFDRSLPLRRCLADNLLRQEMESTEMVAKPEKTRQNINKWVKDKTKGKINNFLPEGSLVGSTVALVNAAYFKGQWQSQFKSADTKKDNFYVSRDKISKADFMEQKGKFNYYTSEELRAHVLEMPYEGEEVSMVVILPPFETGSIHETVSRLTPDTLKGVMAEVGSGFYSVDDLTVKMPKFKIGQRFDLVPTLQKMGLETLFDPSKSDLTGFLEKGAEQKVALESALHETTIEVNEEGSEAAAATALFGFRSARPLFHTHFIADHPFAFMIYDKGSDTVLFFGVFINPKME